MTTCGELLTHLMDAYGIQYAIGIPGTHTIELYRGLPSTNIRHITPRHEQGAGFLADGYARSTGNPAACLTVSGPGGLNIATAMGQAMQDSVPMLVISADNNTYEKGLGEGRLHETPDLQQAMKQCSRWAHTVMRADDLPKIMARAFAIFNSERPGPVHLSIPLDVITSDASHVKAEVWPIPARPAPAPDAIEAAVNLLSSAKNPVIALGGGVADAADMARQLAERLDAPVTITHNAKGILPADHPLHILGNPSYQPVKELYNNADVILGIGTEFGETDYDFFFSGEFHLGNAKLIRIDIDAAQLTRNIRPDLAICSDANYAIKALLSGLEGGSSQSNRQGAARTSHVNQALKALDCPHYQAFLDAILEALPDPILIGDSTQPAYFAAAQYHTTKPRSFASAGTGYGTLGYALPAAFGAKLGQPDRPVVSLNGDGGIQFTINELATAVEAKIPVAVVIWNNEQYEMIAMNFRDAGMEPIACDIYVPDFHKIAEGYGCPTVRVRNLEEFKAALQQSQDASVPTLIEVMECDFLPSSRMPSKP